ncbi:hypothetical protein [Streptomyces sp. NRRL F-5123]|nr:hypothetical protein [Streptomyces sp. NRRL F-5123]
MAPVPDALAAYHRDRLVGALRDLAAHAGGLPSASHVALPSAVTGRVCR